MNILTRRSRFLGQPAPSLLWAVALIGVSASVQGIAEAEQPLGPNLQSTRSGYPQDEQPDPRQTRSYSQGRSLYQGKCARCHALYSPNSYPAGEWPAIVRSMKTEAGLNEGEITTISAYLTTEAGTGGGEDTSYGTGPRIGGYLYTEYFVTQQEPKNFDIHYLAIYLSGWINEKISYFGEFELEHGGIGGNNTFVEQAYIDYWFVPQMAVKIGAMLTPFNRFDEFHDPLANFTITRPQVSREIGVSAFKDVGVDLHGVFDLCDSCKLIYDAYIINGLGNGENLRGSRQYQDNNDELALGGRARFIFCDDYELGVSGYQGAWDDDGLFDVRMLGGHFMAHTAFADFYGEASWADSENPAPFRDGRMTGYFVQASRLICDDRFRTTVRYGSLDYHDTGNLLGRNAAKGDKDLSELVLCLGFYPTPNVVFKFEYVFFMEGFRAAQTQNDQVGFQAAVRF